MNRREIFFYMFGMAEGLRVAMAPGEGPKDQETIKRINTMLLSNSLTLIDLADFYALEIETSHAALAVYVEQGDEIMIKATTILIKRYEVMRDKWIKEGRGT